MYAIRSYYVREITVLPGGKVTERIDQRLDSCGKVVEQDAKPGDVDSLAPVMDVLDFR